ncbi:MAG: PQQ-dependent sugar dehydrogenase [Thermoleophilaceae bacterium]
MRGAWPATVALLTVVGGWAALGAETSESQSSSLRLVRVGTFDSPTFVTAPPGDRNRVFVVEQGGTIRVVRNGRILRRAFLDIRRDVSSGGERGLLSMAFAPDYERSRRFYVYFTDRSGHTRVQEFLRSRRSADRADRRSRRQVLFQRQPFPNHNGGQLQFGPDRLLYVGMGDGGSGGDPQGNGQDLGTFLGKVLRIDPRRRGGRRYTVPRSNPFRGRRGARPEIYAYGLRNPWRFSFDRRTGALTLADVGQSAVEEVNYLREGRARGANFGWNVFEGRRRFTAGSAPGHVRPVLQRLHTEGACSITGGYVVRDRALRALYGRYVYGDFCEPRIRSALLRSGRARGDRATGLRVEGISSFGEDALGRVYVASLDGPVHRLAAR